MICLLSLMFAMSLVTPCETSVRTGLERPYAFRDTPIRPLSIAIEQDTRAYVKLRGMSYPSTCGGCRVPGTSVLQWASTCGHS